MPEPAESGVKSPSSPPGEGTGARGSQSSASSGPPPEDDLIFEDDEVIEQDGKKMVPLEALIKARKEGKRQPAAPPPPPEPDEEPYPEPFNWDKLVQSASGQPQPQPGQPLSPEQFEDNFRDMLNDRPWQAVMWAIQTGMQMRDRMENQARGFVPDYGSLPVHEIKDEEVQAIAQNPYVLRALLAKTRGTGGKRAPAPAGVPSPPPAANPEDLARQIAAILTGVSRQPGLSGESTGGPSSPPPPAEDVQLDQNSVAFLKLRGYTDEQIKEHGKRILERRRAKGMM